MDFLVDRVGPPPVRNRSFSTRGAYRCAAFFLIALGLLLSRAVRAQTTPLISGGVGFFTNTNGGNTTYIPVFSPLVQAPITKRLQVESRAYLLESFFPNGPKGYDTSHYVALTYLQADYFATPHVTVVGGYFLSPFGTYTERLSPIWISNLQDAPLIQPIGTGTGAGLGGMLRGNAYSNGTVSIDYTTYFSARSANEQFSASRSTGFRVNAYMPKQRLEIGVSYTRLLQGRNSNDIGFHVWWLPLNSAFKMRSEYAHTTHAQGYWIETDYRLSRFGGPESVIGRLEPVFRMQQVSRSASDPTDGLPSRDTQRADFGLDYHLPHNVRVNTSYSRQFSASGNRNIWETGIVYRFLFPAWKGK
jgi:hypothetical protein